MNKNMLHRCQIILKITICFSLLSNQDDYFRWIPQEIFYFNFFEEFEIFYFNFFEEFEVLYLQQENNNHPTTTAIILQ